MKKSILLTVIMFLVTILFANADKYTEAMQKNIQIVYATQDVAQLQTAVNAFERIGAAEKNKWEPFYYASFGYIMMANSEKENSKKDTYLDQAEAALTKAKELAPNESEVIALEGFVYMIRLTVDPATRAQKYSSLAMQSLGKANAINPENPRALAMMAQMQYGTAQFFKSSTVEACATVNNAIEKFSTYKSDNVLAPQWGKEMTEELKEKCK